MTPDEMADRLTRELLRGGLESAPEDNFQPMAAVAQLRKADAQGNYNVFIQDEKTGKIAVNPEVMAGKGAGGDDDLSRVSNVSDQPSQKQDVVQGGAQDIPTKAGQDAQFFQSPEVFVKYLQQAIDTGDLQQAIDVVNMGQPEDWEYAMKKLPAWAQDTTAPNSQARLAALKKLQQQFRVEPQARECVEQLVECVEQYMWSNMYDMTNRWV
jgi:hypothetical protein